jgi:hypothetical protein
LGFKDFGLIGPDAGQPGTCGAVTYQNVNQPRTMGIKFGQKF